MLKRIEKWGVENGYFIYDSLKKVSDETCLCKDLEPIDNNYHSCKGLRLIDIYKNDYSKNLKFIKKYKICLCNDLKLIDFDKTKEKRCNEMGLEPYSSCDGLHLTTEINFIEFKSFKRIKKNYNGKENTSEKERKFIKKMPISTVNKIEDSITLFKSIVRHKDSPKIKNKLDEYQNTLINYYLVVDVDLSKNSTETFLAQLNGLTLPSSLYKTLIIQVSSILDDIDGDIKINQAKLIDCKELQKILSK